MMAADGGVPELVADRPAARGARVVGPLLLLAGVAVIGVVGVAGSDEGLEAVLLPVLPALLGIGLLVAGAVLLARRLRRPLAVRILAGVGIAVLAYLLAVSLRVVMVQWLVGPLGLQPLGS